jgi:hypothetical protein
VKNRPFEIQFQPNLERFHIKPPMLAKYFRLWSGANAVDSLNLQPFTAREIPETDPFRLWPFHFE